MACSHGLFLLIPIWIIKHILGVFEVANNGRVSANGGRNRCREYENGLAYWSDRILGQHGSMFLFSLANNFIALLWENLALLIVSLVVSCALALVQEIKG